MRAGSSEHGSLVAMLTPRTPLHFGRPSRVHRYSSSMHRAMEEDSLMTQYDDMSPLMIGLSVYNSFSDVIGQSLHDISKK